MKRILALVLVSVLFTGCTQMQTNLRRTMATPVEVAKEDCISIGFKIGTPQYQNCVLVTSQNIRNARSNEASARELAPRSYGPKTTTCNRVGSSVHCTEF